jgi:hypothetical protein
VAGRTFELTRRTAERRALAPLRPGYITHSADEEVTHDKRRTAFLEAKGYCVVRFSNQQVYENVEAIVGEIARVLAALAR